MSQTEQKKAAIAQKRMAKRLIAKEEPLPVAPPVTVPMKVTAAIPATPAEQERRRMEQQRRPNKKPLVSHQGDTRRLPHGALFDMQFNAGAVMWSGRLTIPTAAGVAEFTSTAPSLFGLCTRLDNQYRRWASANEITACVPAPRVDVR